MPVLSVLQMLFYYLSFTQLSLLHPFSTSTVPCPPLSYPVAGVKAHHCIATAHHDGDTEFTRNDGGGSLPV